MTETGWPLIPREVLPAAVPAPKRKPQPRSAPTGGAPSGQLPFFGAGTLEPSPADLAGLLAGPGRLGRMGGTARISVEVDAAWRVHVLVTELVSRGLVVNWRPINQDQGPADVRGDDRHRPDESGVRELVPVMPDDPDPDLNPDPDFEPDPDLEPDPDFEPDARVERGPEPDRDRDSDPVPDPDPGRADPEAADPGESDQPLLEPTPRFEVLTAYSSRLNALARAWPDAAAQLFLTGPRLRLWVAAAGEPMNGGYALGLDPAKDPREIDAALVRAGLAGRLSDDGRRYLIMGKRRLARLAELVGERPAAAPAEQWPGSASA